MAISYITLSGDSTGTDTLSYAMPGAVAVGDLLVTMLTITGAASDLSPTVSDSLGNVWNLPSELHFYTSQESFGFRLEMVMAWTKVTVAGTPTINASGLGTNGAIGVTAQYTGFMHGPSLVLADITQNQGTSATPSGTGFSNSAAPELILAYAGFDGGQNLASISGSFTARDGVGSGTANAAFADAIESTTGNALTFSGSISSNRWGVMLAGFQDGVPAPAGNAFPSQLFIMP